MAGGADRPPELVDRRRGRHGLPQSEGRPPRPARALLRAGADEAGPGSPGQCRWAEPELELERHPHADERQLDRDDFRRDPVGGSVAVPLTPHRKWTAPGSSERYP